jgi:hypothetical protein
MTIHGGFWRAKYDLAHAGHMCAALTASGIATWNLEFRRAGNRGGGWPGTFEDVRSGYRFLSTIAKKYNLDLAPLARNSHFALPAMSLRSNAWFPCREWWICSRPGTFT